jgi:hypothetical protein
MISNAFNTSPPAGTFIGVNNLLSENISRVHFNWRFNRGYRLLKESEPPPMEAGKWFGTSWFTSLVEVCTHGLQGPQFPLKDELACCLIR